MIPHIIHYCWFGGAPLPPEAVKCMESWRSHFPGWEIKRWDENNYNVRVLPYTAGAYDAGKYAFVSDFARFDILYRHGGIYFDTDVEVIRSFDDIVGQGPFMGMEKLMVNPGLGFGACGGETLLKKIMEHYSRLGFTDASGRILPGTVVSHTTSVLQQYGLESSGLRQNIAGFAIYPDDWFNPLDDITGQLKITGNTRSIHHYAKSWCDNAGPLRTRISRLAHRTIGFKASAFFKRLLDI